MKINVEKLHVGSYDMNCYLAENPDTHELLIVDPGDDAPRIIEAVGDCKPVAVLITHGHFDHIGAVDGVCEHYQIPMYIHALDAPKLTDPVLNVSRQFDCNVVVHTAPVPVEDGQVLSLGGMEITVMHTPGHSKGGVCYLLPDNQGVFCGDTLFHQGYGRYDFADGSFAELKQSLRKLFQLHPQRIAYPGHGSTTVAGK
ncbi:MAG TPA: MBL fold metallo-hydrolase [Candidatus Limiplasma sp.]|nr:MBL fold metallo-hydrolase [Candidatus Limiplasma sp.]